MAYGGGMGYHLHMPSYFWRTFTEYPYIGNLTCSYKAQAFTVHYSSMPKIFQISNTGIIFVKCLQYVINDSRLRNAIRCGITAKVRRKNEYARENR